MTSALTPAHIATRRLNPYRGMVECIDLGDSLALSLDGHTWQLRANDGSGQIRPIGVWVEGEGLKAGRAERCPELLQVLASHPPLPFAMADSVELWLLDKATGLPMALLDAARPGTFKPGPVEVEWHPFVLSYRGFRSATLSERDVDGRQPLPHRDFVARMVNQRARPFAAAQWFRRHPDGSGEALVGLRLEPSWLHRRLDADAFPELLVDRNWNSRLENSVINDYHAWLSPFLLCWPTLADATRLELEAMACGRPQWLLQVHRLLPKVLDSARIQAALVAARLEGARGTPENDLLGY